MNILELKINDLKRITAIEIHPETGKPVILTGDNGNGKSSVLDSIILALSNTGLDDPIRHGRPSGSVKLTLGVDKAEYLLERKVTKGGDKLTLTDAAGIAVQKPQTFLNGLLGNYAFDPLEFTRLKPKEQVEALKVAAGLDFTEIDAKRAEHYAERTIVARDGKDAAAQFAAIAEPAADAPAEELSAAELMAKLQKLEKSAEHLVIAKRQLAEAIEREAKALAEIDRIKEMLKAAEAHQSTCADMIDETQKILTAATADAPTDEQLTAARSAIEQVDKTNAAVRNAKAWRDLDAKVKQLRLDHANLTRRIEEIDEQKKAQIQNANLPLEGLELTEEGVMVNGTFFSQLSTAEQIRVSTLVAMSQNPSLRIVIIREGALMNSANLAMIAKLAAERGFQVWIEKFQEEPSNVGLHIIDGAIAFEDGEAVNAGVLAHAGEKTL
jgi:DNA repair exonuclease SbcCD ATPase subunit